VAGARNTTDPGVGVGVGETIGVGVGAPPTEQPGDGWTIGVGCADGEGTEVGARVGLDEGAGETAGEGDGEGTEVGAGVGLDEGAGETAGEDDGESAGAITAPPGPFAAVAWAEAGPAAKLAAITSAAASRERIRIMRPSRGTGVGHHPIDGSTGSG
jgi:hypothetical protein